MCIIKFMFDYCAQSCLWTVNREADELFGVGIISPEQLTLSDNLKATIKEMCKEYDTCLNWEDPAGESPWTLDQIRNFRTRSTILYNRLLNEIGEGITIENWVDRDLDRRAKKKLSQNNGSIPL